MVPANLKDGVTFVYYAAGAVGLLLAGLRIFYGWFRDYEAATRFTKDMALHHLPYIYKVLDAIATKLEIEDLDTPPNINFSQHNKKDQ